MSTISDFVYMLSGMIYKGATTEEIQEFLEQVPSESRANVWEESKKAVEKAERNSRMDTERARQARDWGN